MSTGSALIIFRDFYKLALSAFIYCSLMEFRYSDNRNCASKYI